MLASRGVRVVCLLAATWSCAAAAGGVDDVVAAAARLGLRARRHIVRTEDGHELSLYRLRGGGAPVLLLPGLLQDAGAWLDAGAAGLAALLAGAGRDVWLSSARGSRHSRRHAWRSPRTDPLFWRFSADEIGRYDLPTLIDHVLAATDAARLDYIGFSQGAGTFFIMCSELPNYCDKVNVMVAMAPAARIAEMRSPLWMAFEFYSTAEQELSKRGVWEVFPQGGVIQSLSQTLCNLPISGTEICEFIKSVYDGSHPGSVQRATFLAAAASFPAGTSVHNMARYGQLVRSGRFAKFDHGPEKNLALYGNETAPAYNLSAVSARTVLLYAREDRLVDVSNIHWLRARLPNLVAAHQVEDPHWSHMDFTMSQNIPKYVYPIIEKYLNKYS